MKIENCTGTPSVVSPSLKMNMKVTSITERQEDCHPCNRKINDAITFVKLAVEWMTAINTFYG